MKLKKNTDHDHSNKYITIQEFNKITAENSASRLAEANLASKNDIAALVKNLNKKVTSNKKKHVKAEKKVTDLTNKVVQLSEKGYAFLLGRMYFTRNDNYQNLLVFDPMLSSLILDSNEKVNNWILTRTSSEKVKRLDTNFEETVPNLAKHRVKI